MVRRKFLIFMSFLLTLVVLSWGVGQGWAQSTKKELKFRAGKLTAAEQKAAAKRAKELGLKPGVAALAAQAPDPGGVPHYFGPYGNWAFSPLPKGGVGSVTVVDGGTG